VVDVGTSPNSKEPAVPWVPRPPGYKSLKASTRSRRAKIHSAKNRMAVVPEARLAPAIIAFGSCIRRNKGGKQQLKQTSRRHKAFPREVAFSAPEINAGLLQEEVQPQPPGESAFTFAQHDHFVEEDVIHRIQRRTRYLYQPLPATSAKPCAQRMPIAKAQDQPVVKRKPSSRRDIVSCKSRREVHPVSGRPAALFHPGRMYTSVSGGILAPKLVGRLATYNLRILRECLARRIGAITRVPPDVLPVQLRRRVKTSAEQSLQILPIERGLATIVRPSAALAFMPCAPRIRVNKGGRNRPSFEGKRSSRRPIVSLKSRPEAYPLQRRLSNIFDFARLCDPSSRWVRVSSSIARLTSRKLRLLRSMLARRSHAMEIGKIKRQLHLHAMQKRAGSYHRPLPALPARPCEYRMRIGKARDRPAFKGKPSSGRAILPYKSRPEVYPVITTPSARFNPGRLYTSTTGGIVKPRSIKRLASFNLRNLRKFRKLLARRAETIQRVPASTLPARQHGSTEALPQQHLANLQRQEELQRAHTAQQTPSPAPRIAQLSHPGSDADSAQRFTHSPQPPIAFVPAPAVMQQPAPVFTPPQAAPVHNTAPVPVVIQARPNPNLGRVAGTVLPPMPMLPLVPTQPHNHVAPPRPAATTPAPFQPPVAVPAFASIQQSTSVSLPSQAVTLQNVGPARVDELLGPPYLWCQRSRTTEHVRHPSIQFRVGRRLQHRRQCETNSYRLPIPSAGIVVLVRVKLNRLQRMRRKQ
jgi:hypothetical protein